MPSGLIDAACFEFRGDRNQVRIQAVVDAFKAVQCVVDKTKKDKS